MSSVARFRHHLADFLKYSSCLALTTTMAMCINNHTTEERIQAMEETRTLAPIVALGSDLTGAHDLVYENQQYRYSTSEIVAYANYRQEVITKLEEHIKQAPGDSAAVQVLAKIKSWDKPDYHVPQAGAAHYHLDSKRGQSR